MPIYNDAVAPRKIEASRTYPINQGLNSPGAGITDPRPVTPYNAYANNLPLNNTQMTDTGTGGGYDAYAANRLAGRDKAARAFDNLQNQAGPYGTVRNTYDAVAARRLQQNQQMAEDYQAALANGGGNGNGATTTTPYSPPGSGATTANGAGGHVFGSTTTAGGTPYSGDYDLSEYLRQQAAARIESELAGLSSAYKRAMNGYDSELRNIERSYYNQRNQSAAQDAIARRNFDERAAASGLNSGTAGQADLARSAAYTGELARLGAAEDAERNAVEMNRANAQAQYEQAIAQARANNQQQLAGDLYKELIRVQGLEREDALNAAKAAASTVRYSGGGGGSSSGTKTSTTPDASTLDGVDWSAVDAWVARYGADAADAFIKANWKALGLGENQTASLAAYENHLRATGQYQAPPEEYSPRLTADQVEKAVKRGEINDETQRMYEFYFGQQYNAPTAPQAGSVTNATVQRPMGRSSPDGRSGLATYYFITGAMPPTATSPYVSEADLANYRLSGDIVANTNADGTITYTWAK